MDGRSWRTHQQRLNKKRKRSGAGKKVVLRLIPVLVIFFCIFTAVSLASRYLVKDETIMEPATVVVVPDRNPEKRPVEVEEVTFEKKELAGIIGSRPFQPDELHTFTIEDGQGHKLYVRTTLDPALQAWAVGQVRKVKAKAVALVAINPHTGEVLAMASYRSDGRPINVALSSSFPAASLFKIVTAAAAMEDKNLNSSSTLSYDGKKHTLYKKDVAKGINVGHNQATLKQSFAQSINSVFGKLGAFTLGPEELDAFARKFHFNQPIDFEMPVQSSHFKTADQEDPYRLAELASGFNRTTTVSPLHGAMLSSAIVNEGILMEPTVVREVFDLNNRIYYIHEPNNLGRVVSQRTVGELRKLMRATVAEGTGRKRFRDASKHPVLSHLEIGGKSGTINNDQGNRVDWFVSFAALKNSNQALALAAVVVHGEKLGTRSQELVREAIIRYFRSRLSSRPE